MKKSQATRFVAVVAVALLSALTFSVARAQVLFSAGSPYTQNFDSLGVSGTTIDGTTLPNWLVFKGAGSAGLAQVTTCLVGTGSVNTGSMYNFGAASATDRALGDCGSGTPGTFAYGVLFQNDTANSITNIVVSYTGEQWRNGGNTSAQTLMFSYQISSSTITSTDPTISNAPPWIYVTSLNFVTPTVGATAAALDGNAAANRTAISANLSGVSVAPGQYVLFRWLNPNDTGNDHAMAVDDLSIAYTGVAPNNNPPSIDAGGQPVNITKWFGQTASFSVSASGKAPLSYQWYYSNNVPAFTPVAIAGAVNSVLSLPAVTNGNVGSYYVVIANDVPGTVTSSLATLTVTPPVVTTIGFLKTLVDANYALTQADSNTVYQVDGIVTTGTNVVNSTASHSYFIEDTSSKKGVDLFFSAALFPTIINQGDIVRVVAPLQQFQGVIELSPVNTAHSITVLTSGNALPSPLVLDLSQVGNAAYMDNLKGSYVIVSNVNLLSLNATFTNGINVTLSNAPAAVIPMLVPGQTLDPVGQTIPAFAYSIKAVLSQSKASSPYTSGYQLLLSFFADINSTVPPPPPVVNQYLSITNYGHYELITWTNANYVLMNANTVNGIFSPDLSATSPYSNDLVTGAAQKYFRLQTNSFGGGGSIKLP